MRGKVESPPRPCYGPYLEKTFENAVADFVSREFPHLGGPRVVELFVKELKEIVEAYYPAVSHMQMGQVLWFAMDKSEKPSYGKRLHNYKVVPVVLSLVAYGDVEKLRDGVSWDAIRGEIVARMYQEADAQGGVLSQVDLSLLLFVSMALVGKVTRRYEEQHQVILPRVGTVLDMGMSVSHKAEICKKAKVEKKQTPDIARECHHSSDEVDRYLLDFDRVRFCLKKGMSVEEASFAMGMSKTLVLKYEDLTRELYQEKRGDRNV